MSRRHLSLFAAVLTSCLAGFLLMAALSHAQVPGAADACTGDGMLDDILCKYKTASGRWSNLIQRAAEWLFWTLVVISMVWTFSMQALRRGDILEILAELTRFTIFVGFFHYLLTNGTYIGETIINSLRMLASQAGGVTNAIRPSGIIDVGLEIVFHVISRSSILSLLDGIFGFFMAAFILVVLATVAIDMLQLLVAAWFLLYAGVFFLGFGGSKWTSDMAIGYFRTVLSIAVQTFAMILLVGLGKSIIDEVYQSATDQNFLYTLGVLVVVAYTIYRLTSRIPPLLGQLVTGSHASGASASGATLADVTMFGSSTVATAAYSMGGSLMAQGVSQAAGMVEAYRAATGVARSELKAGGAGGSIGAGVGPLAAAFGDHLPRGGGGASAGGSASSTTGRPATTVGGAQEVPAVEVSGDGAAAGSNSDSGAAQTPAKPASSDERSISGDHAGASATADRAHATEQQQHAGGDLDATDNGSATHAPADRVAAAAHSKSDATGPEETPAGASAGSGEEESGLADKAATAPPGAIEEDPKQPTAATSGARSTSAAQSKSAAAASQNRAEGATPGQVKDAGPATGPSPSVGVDAANASSSSAAPAAGARAAAAMPPSGGHGDNASSSSTSTATRATPAGATAAAAAGPDGTRSPSSSTAAAAAEGVADNSSSQTGAVAAEASPVSASQLAAGESGATNSGDDGGAHQAEGVVSSGSSRRVTSTAAAAAPRNDAALKAAIRSRAAEIFVETAKREGRQIASAAIENFQARAAARVANTAGGRMAQSIRQRSGEPPALGEVAAFRDGGGSIGAPAAGTGARDHGQASPQSASAHQPAGASVGEVEVFDSAESDSSNAPATRGTHQPTGVRNEDSGKSS